MEGSFRLNGIFTKSDSIGPDIDFRTSRTTFLAICVIIKLTDCCSNKRIFALYQINCMKQEAVDSSE